MSGEHKEAQVMRAIGRGDKGKRNERSSAFGLLLSRLCNSPPLVADQLNPMELMSRMSVPSKALAARRSLFPLLGGWRD